MRLCKSAEETVSAIKTNAPYLIITTVNVSKVAFVVYS